MSSAPLQLLEGRRSEGRGRRPTQQGRRLISHQTRCLETSAAIAAGGKVRACLDERGAVERLDAPIEVSV
ncbi:MAG: hypothetical protein P8Y21_08865 [Gemmatimonadales bacterium]